MLLTILNSKKNKRVFSIAGIIFSFLISSPSYAVCPLCVVAVGAGIGLSHFFGVDDTISGVWIGGLLMALVIWTVDWLNKKNIRFKGRKISILTVYYVFTLIPLYSQGFIGHPLNKLWEIDKLLLGIIFGSVFFLISVFGYRKIKEQRGGQAQFPFQKVVMPVASLLILTLMFHFVIIY